MTFVAFDKVPRLMIWPWFLELVPTLRKVKDQRRLTVNTIPPIPVLIRLKVNFWGLKWLKNLLSTGINQVEW